MPETLSEYEVYELPIPRIVIPILGNADADSGAYRPRRRRPVTPPSFKY
jgi:hypothetical protein